MLVDLLVQFSSDDINTMSENLKKILYNHFRRICTFNKFLITKVALPDYDYEQDGVHRKCTFGQWYYSQTAPQLVEHKDFETLGKIHGELHRIMRKLVLSVQSNRLITQADYDDFIQVYNVFIDQMTNLIDEINFAQFQYDYLTKLLNRRAFKIILNHEYNRSLRNNTSCCIALADIDHFKRVNDKYGHSNGDIVLLKLADFFRSQTRDYDSVSRYGGEEFIFCLPETSLEEASKILNRMREKISVLDIHLSDGMIINVSLSFGITELTDSFTLEESIINTDQALYRAKASGRNCVKIWSPVAPEN
jgi:diguanylate cyclase (GGDEF)-like protein